MFDCLGNENETEESTRSQVPYENYRKVFRSSQRHIERELGAVQSSASDLARRVVAAGSERNSDDSVKAIDAMIARIENLKRKVRLSWCICYVRAHSVCEHHSCQTSKSHRVRPRWQSCASDPSTSPQWNHCRRRQTRSFQDGLIPGWIGGLWIGRCGWGKRGQQGKLHKTEALR